ncbi:MAG: SpoIIE family protein phosphatase, partial [Planctomycetes bacterium]|nr:SpoIIE family protein phosphatase [Planctomycetota bacterium]
ILVTDGYFEWKNPANEQFGIERILDLTRKNRDLPADEMIRLLNESVLSFAQGTCQADDLTALIVKKL